MSYLGDTIRELRKEKKMSQEELASLLDISRPTLIKYEKGVSEPSFDMLMKMGDFLEYDFIEDEYKTEFDEYEWRYQFLKKMFLKMGFACEDSYERRLIDETTTIYKNCIRIFNNEHEYSIESSVIQKKLDLILEHVQLELNALLEEQEDGTEK